MDAWLKQTSRPQPAAKKASSGSLNYSKFDRIVDSDDEEEEKQRRRSVARRAAQPRGPEDFPPHLRSAYARVTMAQERGDPRELQAAMLDLERQLQSMPDDFKEQLKPFFQQFAESGQAIGAEDIKAYFAKLRGDEQDIKEAGEAAASNGDRKDGENGRHEQSGY